MASYPFRTFLFYRSCRALRTSFYFPSISQLYIYLYDLREHRRAKPEEQGGWEPYCGGYRKRLSASCFQRSRLEILKQPLAWLRPYSSLKSEAWDYRCHFCYICNNGNVVFIGYIMYLIVGFYSSNVISSKFSTLKYNVIETLVVFSYRSMFFDSPCCTRVLSIRLLIVRAAWTTQLDDP